MKPVNNTEFQNYIHHVKTFTCVNKNVENVKQFSLQKSV